MKKSLLNTKSISPACGICAKGRISPDGESVLCVKSGIRKLDSSCGSFKYDPLKRRPNKLVIEPYNKSEFEL